MIALTLAESHGALSECVAPPPGRADRFDRLGAITLLEATMTFTFTHRNSEMQLDKPRTALVVTDMQNEFLEPKKSGTYYEMIADGLKERGVVSNLERLLATAQELGYYVIHSPHWYYPTDLQWTVPGGAIADYLASIGFCGRKDPVDLEGFEGSRADYFGPFKKYLMDGHTCNTAPHKHFGCEANDVIKQLHMRGVQKVIMAGPVANICLESHMRDIWCRARLLGHKAS